MQRIEELEQVNSELSSEVQQLSQRETEHLEFSGRLTEKNSCLQADNSHLSAKVFCALYSTQSMKTSSKLVVVAVILVQHAMFIIEIIQLSPVVPS